MCEMKDNMCREGNLVLVFVKVLGFMFRFLELYFFVGNRYFILVIKLFLLYDWGDELFKICIFIGLFIGVRGYGSWFK